MTPDREEELLEIAEALAGRLESAQVPLLKDLGRVGRGREHKVGGISPSCLGNATAFLSAESDMTRFGRFVDLLEQLDAIVGQNQTNPRAEHAILKQELLRFLREQPKLDRAECLYVLKWAQRLIPSKAATGKKGIASGPVKKAHVSTPKPKRKAPEVFIWESATLTWVPNEGRLEARHGSHRADTRDRSLLDALPEGARTKLTRKKNRKPLSCNVTVRKLSERWFEIVELRMSSS